MKFVLLSVLPFLSAAVGVGGGVGGGGKCGLALFEFLGRGVSKKGGVEFFRGGGGCLRIFWK